MELQIKNLSKKLSYKLAQYEVEVGLLENSKRKQPIFGQYKSYAGKKLLREGKVSKGASNAEVAEYLDKRYKWLRKPFLLASNKEVVDVVNFIVQSLNGKGDRQRVLNGMQAVIRNPILRGEYEKNNAKWAKKKGFDDALLMTGQFFKAIKARFKNNV